MSNHIRDFSIPKNGEAYVDSVLERCERYIETKIWHGIEKHDIDLWLKNFMSVEERYFAVIILDTLIYRSAAQTNSQIKQLFQRILPNLEFTGNLDANWISVLAKQRKTGIRLVPVLKYTDPPTKSGSIILRIMKRSHEIKEDFMIWPWQIKAEAEKDSNIRTILFIDDFLGSGDQFESFFSGMIKTANIKKELQYIYIPLMAFDKGIERIKELFPDVLCEPVEALSESHKIFSVESQIFGQGGNEENTPFVAKEFYKKIIYRKGFPQKYQFGYNDLELAIAFEHGIPNCSLPILWCKTKNWNPLFHR